MLKQIANMNFLGTVVTSVQKIYARPVSSAALYHAVAPFAGPRDHSDIPSPHALSGLWRHAGGLIDTAFDLGAPPRGELREKLVAAFHGIASNIEFRSNADTGAALINKKYLAALSPAGLSQMEDAAKIYALGEGFDNTQHLVFRLQNLGTDLIARQLRLSLQALKNLAANDWDMPRPQAAPERKLRAV